MVIRWLGESHCKALESDAVSREKEDIHSPKLGGVEGVFSGTFIPFLLLWAIFSVGVPLLGVPPKNTESASSRRQCVDCNNCFACSSPQPVAETM